MNTEGYNPQKTNTKITEVLLNSVTEVGMKAFNGMNGSPQEAVDAMLKMIQDFAKKLVCMNIMVLGKSGVGKSTLINSIFGENLAETAIGKPVTGKIMQLKKQNFPLTIYDTPGFELNGEHDIDELLKQAIGVIDEGYKSGEVEKAIHCILFCISTASHRFEDAEKDFIKKLTSETKKYKIRVIIVLTQSYRKKDTEELRAVIKKENLDVAQIVPVIAEKYDIDEEYVVKTKGLDKLVDVIQQVIPEAVNNTFVAIQKVSIEKKQDLARSFVKAAAVAAAGIGATPIPFSDAFALVPTQLGMLTGISHAFGLSFKKDFFKSLIGATIGTAGTTILGKTVVSQLLKFIPGVGSVVGGAISAGAAASLTTALGETYISLMTQVAEGVVSLDDLETKKGQEDISRAFEEHLKMKRDATGQKIE